MGMSTVQQLVQRAKSMNEYNNSGVATDAVWVDFFNEALMSMVDELNIQEEVQIIVNADTKTYDLPENYYSLKRMVDVYNNEISAFKDEGINFNGGRSFRPGYDVKYKGSKFVMEFPLVDPTTMTLTYTRYPERLEVSRVESQKPEVPTVGETALCYKAIAHALENNNLPGQAREYEEKYLREVEKIHKASFRARGQ